MMVHGLIASGAIVAIAVLIPACTTSPEVTTQCREWTNGDLKGHILSHMKRNDPLGSKPSMSLTVEDITVTGETRLGGSMWMVPFKVPDSATYTALVDCSGYTELSGG